MNKSEEYKIPTVLEQLDYRVDERGTTFAIQIFIPQAYRAADVAKFIYEDTGLICHYPKYEAGPNVTIEASHVYCDVNEDKHRLPEIRKRIIDALNLKYLKLLTTVNFFLNTFDAPLLVRESLLRWKDMWSAWNGLIDKADWADLFYIIERITDDNNANKLKAFELHNLGEISSMWAYYVANRSHMKINQVFGSGYLKLLNPFIKPEV